MNNKKSLKPELIVQVTRGNIIESQHSGWICVLNKDKKVIYKKGDILDKVYLRSCAKPIQAIPTVENIEITGKELAIICGSHLGSEKHLEVLNKFMKRHRIKSSDLKCGIHTPSDENEKIKLIKKSISPNQLHNNCSGKHLGMLALCKKCNWDLKSYLSSKHPLQKIILKNVENLSETTDITIGVDGCGLPTFGLPIINIAYLFSNFTGKSNKTYKKIVSAMTKYPFLIGGENQTDTEIIRKSKNKLLAKVGGAGIIVVVSKGNCAVVKIADGSPNIRSYVILNLIIKLGWLKEREIRNSTLEETFKGEIKNHAGKPVGKNIILI